MGVADGEEGRGSVAGGEEGPGEVVSIGFRVGPVLSSSSS